MAEHSHSRIPAPCGGWVRTCALVALFLVAFPVWAQQPAPAAPREVLVKFRTPTPSNIDQIVRDEDIELTQKVGGADVHLLRSRSKDALTLVRRLGSNTEVVYAEPNYILRAIGVPNDPRFTDLWGLQNTGQSIGGVAGKPGADIGAVSAWDVSTGSRTTVVAVVDTGIDYSHPELASNVWSAPTGFTVTVGSRAVTCPAGSHGFNAITYSCDPMDDENHGTHVSGTIGAAGNNSVGVTGVNWTASVMGLKFLDETGSGYTSDAINAIEFAIQVKRFFGSSANVRVLSNSWGGGGFNQALLDEINRANGENMLFVAAAGNTGGNNDLLPIYPASYTAANVIAVAATDNNDARASFSSYGPSSVDLGAPGVWVLSTLRSGSYGWGSGTSMAAPHVSGAAALVLSRCTLDTAGLKSNLMTNVDPIASLAGLTVTGGRLNVNKAIRACNTAPVPNFSLSATPTSRTIRPGAIATYRITISPSGGLKGGVTFSVSGLPPGTTASFAPPVAWWPGSTSLTVVTSADTPADSYTLTISGVNGSLTRTTTVSLIVSTSADFLLSVTPTSRTLPPGGLGTYKVTVAAVGGFNTSVALNVAGLPSGATTSLSPASVTGSGSSTVTVVAGSASPVGSYMLTISGVTGSVIRTTTASLVVSTDANFTVSATPASRTIPPGTTTTYAVTVGASGGFDGKVNLSLIGLPVGVTASFNPSSFVGPGSSTLTVVSGAGAAAGAYILTITGTCSSLIRTAPVSLVINPAAGFSLSATPSSRTVIRGTSTTYAVSVIPTADFGGKVAFSVTGLPAGASAFFNPASLIAAGSSTLTVRTATSTPAGTYTLTIIGSNGSLVRSSSVSLVVSVP